MSFFGKAKGWLGKKKPERSDRVTRAAASPSAVRVSYNEDHVPVELLEDTNPACAMMYPCDDFLTATGIKEEFYGLCANTGLTRLALCRVVQYKNLTSCFVNSFCNNHDVGTVEFKLYNDLITMSLAQFCDIIGVPNVGQTTKMTMQPSGLRTLFNSICCQEETDIRRTKISSIHFPHLRYFAYFVARGVLAHDNTSNGSAPDFAIYTNALSDKNEYNVGALIARCLVTNSNKGDIYGGIYATLILESLDRTPHPDDVPFSYASLDLAAMKRHKFVTMTSQFGNLDYILRFERTITREIRLPAPLLFDNTRRNGWSFNEIQFDEFMANYQPHNPMEGVVPVEEEHGEFTPFQGETFTEHGEGSSSAWSAGPSSWEDPRTSVYAPEGSYDP